LGAFASIAGAGLYGKGEMDKMLPEGGIQKLYDDCRPLWYSSNVSLEQGKRDMDACVDKQWLPAKDRRDEILEKGICVSAGFLLAAVFSGVVIYRRGRQLNEEVDNGVRRYLDGLDFRRGDRKAIQVVDGGKPPEPKV
jgi:hypothetical protein